MMKSLLAFYAILNALLESSDLEFHEVNGVRIFPVRSGDLWTTKECVVLTSGKNIPFTVNSTVAREDPNYEATRIMHEIEKAAGNNKAAHA